MNILVLGGTRLVGRGFVEVALGAGHAVTLFHRGQTHPERFPAVERVLGDRETDLHLLQGRTWDAVYDPSASQPHRVEAALRALGDRVGTWIFVSSVSVYAGPDATDESSPLAAWDGTSGPVTADNYGGYKARCEELVYETMGERALTLRLGLVVGPYDESNRYNQWVMRIAQGGRVLAPGPRHAPVQLIDGRDAGLDALSLLEKGARGPYNLVGPTLTLEEALEATRAGTGSNAELCWADHDWLIAQGLKPWEDLPLWTAPEDQWMWRLSGARLQDIGPGHRPLARSARDALAWELSRETPTPAGLPPDRERALLEALDGGIRP